MSRSIQQLRQHWDRMLKKHGLAADKARPNWITYHDPQKLQMIAEIRQGAEWEDGVEDFDGLRAALAGDRYFCGEYASNSRMWRNAVQLVKTPRPTERRVYRWEGLRFLTCHCCSRITPASQLARNGRGYRYICRSCDAARKRAARARQ